MLGGIVKGLGSSLAGSIADVAGISTFTSAAGGEKPTDKPKAAKVKAFDEDEAPTKVLQRILGEVQSVHKVIASQIIPSSEEKEVERDKDKKDGKRTKKEKEADDDLVNVKPKIKQRTI